mgnify:CR=1 FL=1
MSIKEIEMTQTLQELKLISESTHDKEVRNSVTILVNHILRTEHKLNQNKDE